MTSASNPPTADDEAGDILLSHDILPSNPVTRARLRVEAEVPSARRGPGWDRHWRELEAYVESLAEWQGGQPPA
ncbi:MAG: hypothetical protein EOP61_40635 [Sphingomonadales bacterium]|nr:MAG: hypothetical protein EOP61_40635 [Sphingomonadales bacterium]